MRASATEQSRATRENYYRARSGGYDDNSAVEVSLNTGLVGGTGHYLNRPAKGDTSILSLINEYAPTVPIQPDR
jgi:hypothetical protein